MRITDAMHAAALESLSNDPLAQKLVQAFWSQPEIGETSMGSRITYMVGKTRFPDAASAYTHCVEQLGRRLANTARKHVSREAGDVS